MAMYDVSLSASESVKNSTGPVSLGGTRGGGMEMNFGGINDSPAIKWLFPVLGAVLLLGGVALWWFNRKKT